MLLYLQCPNALDKVRRAKYLFELHQKWCLFLSYQLSKDIIFDAAQTKLGPSYLLEL